MTILRTLIISIALAVSMTATADFNTVDQAHEVALSQFRMPTSSNGALSFRECAGCVAFTYRVTVSTQYLLNNSPLELADFRKALAKVQHRDREMIIVMRNLESDTITSVSVTL
jgi:hypothetical protein